MKTIKRPTEPGTYAEHVTEEGFVRYYPITDEQIARRHALADALGFTMRKPCSFCTAGYPTACQGEGTAAEGKHQHFVCYESKALEPRGYASVHVVHDTTKHAGLPSGVITLTWPEEVTKAVEAAEAVQRGEARAPTELRDGEDEYEEGDPDLPI